MCDTYCECLSGAVTTVHHFLIFLLNVWQGGLFQTMPNTENQLVHGRAVPNLRFVRVHWLIIIRQQFFFSSVKAQ